MFLHEPDTTDISVDTLVLWDDPDLAFHAVEICREIEERIDRVKFHIEEAAVDDLVKREDELRSKACGADLILVAFHETIYDLPDRVKTWFEKWAETRDRQAGALAVMRAADHVDCERFREFVRGREDPFAQCSAEEEAFRRFLEGCARRAHSEFFWGCLESDLEEATRGLRILRAS